MSEAKLTFLLLVLVLLVIGVSQSVFIVDQREQALVLQLGQPIGEIRTAGLHYKIPLIQDVRRFDARILSVDPPPEQVVISGSTDNPLVMGALGNDTEEEGAKAVLVEDETISGEPIIVDTFARYKIVNALQFMKTLRNVREAEGRIQNIVNESTRSVLGQTTLRELLSEERGQVMSEILSRVNSKVEGDNLGIEVVDVRIVRADLTPELRLSTVKRMTSELRERATETRAKGEERALEIRSTAEKNRTVILAEAQKDAQILRGEGDKEAIRTYTDAFNKDPEFYAFIRSLEAYRTSFSDKNTRLILSPDSDFFRFFGGNGK